VPEDLKPTQPDEEQLLEELKKQDEKPELDQQLVL
jgi:hypothetical protein